MTDPASDVPSPTPSSDWHVDPAAKDIQQMIYGELLSISRYAGSDEERDTWKAAAEHVLSMKIVTNARPAEEGWVSVEERLPEIGDHVLTFRPAHKVLPMRSQTLIGKNFVCNCCERITFEQPTHWCPLPEPPKPSPPKKGSHEEK